ERSNANPKRRRLAQLLGAKERNCEENGVDDPIKDVGRVINQLKCFLNSRTNLTRNRDNQRDRTNKNNRVDWCFESRMQTREPAWQQSVPARNHGQAGTSSDM